MCLCAFYRSSVSDGVRAIHLRPGIVECHICYIVALSASGETKQVHNASEEFNKRFPKERMELKRALERCKTVCVCVCVSVVFMHV